MNKNKLSRFLLSTSVGIIATLGVSEVSALSSAELVTLEEVYKQRDAAVAKHTADAVAFYKQKDSSLSDERALQLADMLVSDFSGLSALNSQGDQTHLLFEHFADMLLGGVPLTPEHFQSYLTKVTDARVLRTMGVDSVRDLKSPEAERAVVPKDITSVDDAVYFAKQRRESGEFEAAAGFYLKAFDLKSDVAKGVE